MKEINQKINTFIIDEEFLKLIEDDIKKQQIELEKWKAKYTWNMKNQRFVSKLNHIINKIYNLETNDCEYGYYSVGSDEDSEDYDYLVSLENYLVDFAQEYKIPIGFYSYGSSYAMSSIIFRYCNKLYMLEHGQGQGSYMCISHIKNNQLNKINNKDIINLN